VIDYWRRGIEDLGPFVQMAYVDTRLSLSDDLLTYGDKMLMAASVEARVPFLGIDYMRLVEKLPPGLSIRGRTHKYIHKKAIAKWLPPDVIGRRKRGFETPVDRWFRSEYPILRAGCTSGRKQSRPCLASIGTGGTTTGGSSSAC